MDGAYGMQLHWQKFQIVPVNSEAQVHLPDGSEIEAKDVSDYLGALIAADGAHSNELNRRIGAANTNFNSLAKVWRHSNLTGRGQVRVFTSLVASRLLYSLSSLCHSVAEQRQLNGFQNRCLRHLVGIKPSFISRITNAEVLRQTGHTLATTLLLKRQLQLFGNVLRSPERHPLRLVSFIPGTNHPLTNRYVRRRGRPAREWVPEMIGKASALFGSMAVAEQAASEKPRWNARLCGLIC